VKQRVKTLTNQQKESDERLTSFEKDVRASAWLSKLSQEQLRQWVVMNDEEMVTNV